MNMQARRHTCTCMMNMDDSIVINLITPALLTQGPMWASRCPLHGPRVYCKSSPLTRELAFVTRFPSSHPPLHRWARRLLSSDDVLSSTTGVMATVTLTHGLQTLICHTSITLEETGLMHGCVTILNSEPNCPSPLAVDS